MVDIDFVHTVSIVVSRDVPLCLCGTTRREAIQCQAQYCQRSVVFVKPSYILFEIYFHFISKSLVPDPAPLIGRRIKASGNLASLILDDIGSTDIVTGIAVTVAAGKPHRSNSNADSNKRFIPAALQRFSTSL